MLYMVTFTINISQMLAYIPYMEPMGYQAGYATDPFLGAFRHTTDPFPPPTFPQVQLTGLGVETVLPLGSLQKPITWLPHVAGNSVATEKKFPEFYSGLGT